MFRKLASRLFLTHFLVAGIALMLVSLSLLLILLRGPWADQRTLAQLERSIPLVLRGRGQVLLDLPAPQLEAAVGRLDQVSGVRVVLLDPRGRVLADSREGEGEIPLPTRQAIVQGGAPPQGRFRGGGEGLWLYIAEPLVGGHWLLLASPRPALRTLQVWGEHMLRPLTLAGAIALALSIVLSWMVSRWVASPLKRVAEAARAVAAGEFNGELQLEGPEEARELAQAFNEMVHQVRSSQQSQRDFVANISHELRTPLTSIQGFAQAILDGAAAAPEDQRHAAQVIYDESDRLVRLVEDLLDLARLDAGQMDFRFGRVDLQAVVRAVAERLSVRAAEAEVRVQLKLPALPPIVGDGDRLAQVFTNLVDNAIKHTPAGSEVRIWGEASEGWVTVYVDDNGPGIPPEEISRIFERFYQLDKSRAGGKGRGTGLGLPISQEIVRAHGGRIVAQSRPGRGSRFAVQLPIVRSQDATLISPRDSRG